MSCIVRGHHPLASDLRRQFVAVHSRKTDVDQPDIGASEHDRRKRRGPIMCHHDVVAEELQCARHHLGGVDTVLDNQHREAVVVGRFRWRRVRH
jgi:hypothetical protein